MDSYLEVENLSVGYNNNLVLRDISISFISPQFVALLGKNGCGKTTFLRSILKILNFDKGCIKIFGKNIEMLSQKELAKYISFIPQLSMPLNGFTVCEVVEMGRIPHKTSKKINEEKIFYALEKMNLLDLKDKYVTQISGGEYQRVLIARALAQETKIMLLDEPTSHLDLKNKVETLHLLHQLKNEKLIIAVMHDIEYIKNVVDRVVFIKDGKIYSDKPANLSLNKETLEKVFDIQDFHFLL